MAGKAEDFLDSAEGFLDALDAQPAPTKADDFLESGRERDPAYLHYPKALGRGTMQTMGGVGAYIERKGVEKLAGPAPVQTPSRDVQEAAADTDFATGENPFTAAMESVAEKTGKTVDQMVEESDVSQTRATRKAWDNKLAKETPEAKQRRVTIGKSLAGYGHAFSDKAQEYADDYFPADQQTQSKPFDERLSDDTTRAVLTAIVENAPNTAMSLGAAKIMGKLGKTGAYTGAAGSSYVLESGDIFQTGIKFLENEYGGFENVPDHEFGRLIEVSQAHGLFNAGLDALMPGNIASAAARRQLADRAIQKLMSGKSAKEIGGSTIKNAFLELAPELVQEDSSIVGESRIGIEHTPKDIANRKLQAAIAGGGIGGITGAASGVSDIRARNAEVSKAGGEPPKAEDFLDNVEDVLSGEARGAKPAGPAYLPPPRMIVTPEGEAVPESQYAPRTTDGIGLEEVAGAKQGRAPIPAEPAAPPVQYLPPPRTVVTPEGVAATEAQLDTARRAQAQRAQELGTTEVEGAVQGRAPLPEIEPSVDESARDPEDLIKVISRAGGLSRGEAQSQGIDPVVFTDQRSRQVFGRPLFPKQGGMTMDGLAEFLSQRGFLPEGQYSANEALDLVDRALRGEKIYSTYNAADAFEKQAAEREADMREQSGGQAGPVGLNYRADDLRSRITAVQKNRIKSVLGDDAARLWEPKSDDFALSGYIKESPEVQDLAASMYQGRRIMGDDAFEAFFERFSTQNADLDGDAFESKLTSAIRSHGNAQKPGDAEENRPGAGRVEETAQPRVSQERENLQASPPDQAGQEVTPSVGADRSARQDRPETRRQNTEQRKSVAQMSTDELRRELLTDSLTGLPNRRAYDESTKKPVQVAIDLDSLKWINDSMGHESGDKALAALGQALRESGLEAYHISGDEFMVQGEDRAAIEPGMTSIRSRLDNAVIHFEHPDGSTTTKTGVHFSYGIGATRNEADTALSTDKANREASGRRAARGEAPGGVERRAKEQSDNQDRSASNQEVTPTEQPPDSRTPRAGTEPPSKEGVSLSASEKTEAKPDPSPQADMFAPMVEAAKAMTKASEDLTSAVKEIKNDKPTAQSEMGTGTRNELADADASPGSEVSSSPVDEAAHEAATSPQNDIPQPTAAQKDAGNYAKGHVTIGGLDIAIENPAGSKRRPEWPDLKSHYGYFKRTEGKDGDQVDVFVKPGTPDDYSGPVFVVDQTNKDGKFDEHKVMLGFDSGQSARAGYLENYTPGWTGLGALRKFSLGEFKLWLKSGNTKKPVALPTKKPESAIDKAMRSVGLDPNALPDKAKSLRREAEKLMAESRKMLERIPAGQPVSSTADRNLRDRSAEKARKAGDLFAEAEKIEVTDATDSSPAVAKPILARLADRHEQLGGKPRTLGYNTIPSRDGYEVVYKPYGADGDKSGAGYYYVLRPDNNPVAKSAATESDKKPDSIFPEYDAHDEILDRLHKGDITPDEIRAHFQKLLDSKDAITAGLSALTKDKLLKLLGGMLAQRYKSEPKASIVGQVYDSMLNDMNLSNSVSYTMGAGNYQASLKKAVDRVTEADIKEFSTKVAKQREERAETIANIAKAVKDPKTLDDFHTYLRFKISDGKMTAKEARMSLTPEQRAAYDDLSAEKSRNERSAMEDLRKTDVRVAATTAEGQIVETKHTKSGIDLFVVKAAERVDRDVYNQWNATAKRLGGYYSSFRGAGAVPGFQFKTRDNADAFLKFIGGNVEQAQEVAQARRDAFKDDRSQSAVERLNEMADKLEERADESLGQERKSNTARRARFAASAEAAAETNKALAATMRNIAKAIEDGKAKFLNRVRQKSQVEMLRSFVRRAQNDELRAKYPAYIDQEKHKGASPTSETIDYAEFPKYTAFRSDLARLGRELEQIDGTKKLGTAILKVADDVTDTYLKFAKEKLHLVSTFGRSDGKPAIFASRVDAEAAIKRSGYKGKAVVLPFKRNQNIIILSPSAAQEKGIWDGDQDKRITLTADAGAEIVAKVKAMGTRHRVSMPYIFENVAEDLARLKTMGIETPQEFRAALREFVGLRVTTKAPDKIKEMERAMIGRRKDGLDFFPTPTNVAQDMIEAAGIEEGMAVLEPSAGMGHIAEQIRAAGVDPDVVEMSGDRRELLELKGFNVVGSDFMDIKPRELFTYGDTFRDKDGNEGVMRGSGGLGSGRVGFVDADGDRSWVNRDDLTGIRKNGVDSGYDRIIMNPPFSDRRDAEHVQHAYELLRPGGRLVALMGEGVFFGQDKKAVEFREWLEAKNGTSEKLGDGAFLDPSLPVNTGVSARMVVIDKAKESDSDAPQFSRESDDATSAEGNGISLPNGVDANLKEKAAALEEAAQDAGAFKITSARLLDAVLKDSAGKITADLKAVKILQDLFGAPVAFITATSKFKFHGVYHNGTIWLNPNSPLSLPLVFGHELSHRMKADNPSAYRALLKAISPMLRNVDAYEEKNNLYGMKNNLIAEEMLGDVMGDRFGEPEFWQQVAANTNRSEFHKIIDAIRLWIGRAIARLRGLGKDGGLGSKEFIGDLEAARKIIAKAVAEYAQTRKAGLSASNEPQFSRDTTPATEDSAKAERDKMHAGILDAYRAKARKVVDRIDKALDPLGSLPESRAYLAKRYRTLGVIANADAIAKSIGKAFGTATPEDRIAVYDYLTTRDAAPAGIRNELVRAEAAKVKRMIESVGDAMVARGILSEDARETHRGSYLPQLYLKWMLNESDVKLLGAGKKPGPMGYLKGRKIERTKGPDGEPQFVWRESGEPMTDAQVLDLGPISDPGFLAATAIATPIRDMALLDFLSHISQNEKWVLPNSLIEFDGTHTTPQWLKDEADRLRRQADHYGPEEAKKARDIADRMDTAANKALKEFGLNTKDLKRYRQIPNTRKYGRLRGLWVRKEIYDDLVGVYDLSPADPGFVQSLLGYGGIGTKVTQLWKMGKVSLNPPAQVRNFVSNMVLLQLSGVPLHKIPGYIKKAVGEIANNGDHWKIAKKYGVTESTFATQELYRIRRDLLDLEMREGRLHTLGKIHRAGAIIADTASDAYQFMEALGKTIKIMHGMENGVSEAEAAIDAQKWLFDYSLVPKGVRYARNAPIGMPFLCVDEATEALTKDGWKGIDEIKEGDMVASFGMKSQHLEWKPVTWVYRDNYDGPMEQIKDRHLDMLLTPHHRCVTYRKRRVPGGRADNVVGLNLEIVAASDLNVADHIPVAARFDRKPEGEPISDAMVKVLAWVATEGSLHPKCAQVRIYQNLGKSQPIRDALAEADMTWGEYVTAKRVNGNDESVCFHVHAEHGRKIRELLPNKKLTPALLNRLTSDQIEILIETMIDGDGCRSGKQAHFIQKKGETAESFKMALVMAGRSFGVHDRGNGIEQITLRAGKRYCVKRALSGQVQYKGRIWCPEVPGFTTWVARRNGKVFITGNTFQYKVLPRLAEVALLHPQRLIPWVTLFAGWPLLWAALAGEDDDEHERLQKAMPKWLQERGHAMILPYKDEEGRWQVVDLGYFMPWSMYTDLLGDMSRGELGEAAQTAGLFSGPVTNVIVAMKTGKDSFTGRDIMDPGDPPGRQFVSALNYTYDMMMPPIVSSRGLASPIGLLDAEYGGKVVQAATGRTNKYGDPTATATQTALYPIGINLYSLEPQHATAQNVLRLKYEVDQTELALKRKLQNRGLDDDARREKVQEYTDEIKRRNEKINEYLGR